MSFILCKCITTPVALYFSGHDEIENRLFLKVAEARLKSVRCVSI